MRLESVPCLCNGLYPNNGFYYLLLTLLLCDDHGRRVNFLEDDFEWLFLVQSNVCRACRLVRSVEPCSVYTRIIGHLIWSRYFWIIQQVLPTFCYPRRSEYDSTSLQFLLYPTFRTAVLEATSVSVLWAFVTQSEQTSYYYIDKPHNSLKALSVKIIAMVHNFATLSLSMS